MTHILWTLAAVALICYFVAIYNKQAEIAQWGQFTPPMSRVHHIRVLIK